MVCFVICCSWFLLFDLSVLCFCFSLVLLCCSVLSIVLCFLRCVYWCVMLLSLFVVVCCFLLQDKATFRSYSVVVRSIGVVVSCVSLFLGWL